MAAKSSSFYNNSCTCTGPQGTQQFRKMKLRNLEFFFVLRFLSCSCRESSGRNWCGLHPAAGPPAQPAEHHQCVIPQIRSPHPQLPSQSAADPSVCHCHSVHPAGQKGAGKHDWGHGFGLPPILQSLFVSVQNIPVVVWKWVGIDADVSCVGVKNITASSLHVANTGFLNCQCYLLSAAPCWLHWSSEELEATWYPQSPWLFW